MIDDDSHSSKTCSLFLQIVDDDFAKVNDGDHCPEIHSLSAND